MLEHKWWRNKAVFQPFFDKHPFLERSFKVISVKIMRELFHLKLGNRSFRDIDFVSNNDFNSLLFQTILQVFKDLFSVIQPLRIS